MLHNMIVLATNAHAGQFDMGGTPYILHPLEVMRLVNSDDEEIQCIAVGHDLLEDTKVTIFDLYNAGMTQRVVEGIVALTKTEGQTYDEYKEKVFANRDAMIVKADGDLRHNSDFTRLRGVKQKDFDRIAKYMLFYTEIKARLAGS
jgi:(p)ppGpp synthase/HD superfamily hydrolase